MTVRDHIGRAAGEVRGAPPPPREVRPPARVPADWYDFLQRDGDGVPHGATLPDDGV